MIESDLECNGCPFRSINGYCKLVMCVMEKTAEKTKESKKNNNQRVKRLF